MPICDMYKYLCLKQEKPEMGYFERRKTSVLKEKYYKILRKYFENF